MGKTSSDHSLEMIIIPALAILGWPFIIAFGLLSLESKIRTELIIAGFALTAISALGVAWLGKFSGYCTVGVVVGLITFIVWLINSDLSDN